MLHIPDAGFISTLIVGISSSLYFSYISATNTFNTPANIITKIGFHFVFLSSTTLIAKISTMSHLIPSMLIMPLPQKAVTSISTPAEAIIDTTAGRREYNLPCSMSNDCRRGLCNQQLKHSFSSIQWHSSTNFFSINVTIT